MLIRYDLVQDNDITVMGLKKLVQLKDDRAKKMVNNSFSFDFKVNNVNSGTYEAPTINCIHFKSTKTQVCLSENPFLLFGKFFNVRIKDFEGLCPFYFALSRSESFFPIKQNILSHFYHVYPNFRSKNLPQEKPAVDVETLLNRSKKPLRRASTHDDFQQTSSVSVNPPEDIKGESICLLVEPNTNRFEAKMRDGRLQQTIYDLRGPFGQGMGLSRHCFGSILICASGSGCFPFVDLVDFLCRFYIYRYVLSKGVQDKKLLAQLDPFSDDFELTFNNNPTFYFILDFESKLECDVLIRDDLVLIWKLEQELKLGVIGGISIRLQKAELNYEAELGGLKLSKVAKTNAKSLGDRLTEVGLVERGPGLDQKVEKAIINGPKDYLRDLREGFIDAGVTKNKFKSL